MWQQLISVAIRAQLGARAFEEIKILVLAWLKTQPLRGEGTEAFNRRRRDNVVREVQKIWPDLRASLIDVAISILVARYSR